MSDPQIDDRAICSTKHNQWIKEGATGTIIELRGKFSLFKCDDILMITGQSNHLDYWIHNNYLTKIE